MKLTTLRRWAPWITLVVLFSIATTLLSWWQFSRREEIVERIDQVIQNYDKPAVPLAALNWQLDEFGQTDDEWTPVMVSGSYLPQEAVIVRNRPLSEVRQILCATAPARHVMPDLQTSGALWHGPQII